MNESSYPAPILLYMHQFPDTLRNNTDNGCEDASWQSPALGTISESFPRTGGQAAHAGAELCLMLSRPCHLARSSRWKETWASNSAASGHNSASWSDLIFTCSVIKWTWEARHRRHRYLLPSASCSGQDRAAWLWPPTPGLRAPSHQSWRPTAREQSTLAYFDCILKIVLDFLPLSHDAGCQWVTHRDPSGSLCAALLALTTTQVSILGWWSSRHKSLQLD